MIRRLWIPALVLVASTAPALAQPRLTLAEAIGKAQTRNLDARSAEVAERQAKARLTLAKAGYLPTVELSETWQRGNQPVFVFSSLLAQRQFAASNFAIDALNHPEAVGNVRTAATLDQVVFDPAVRAGVRTATLGREAAIVTREVVGQNLAVAVTRAYGAVLAAEAATGAAGAAVDTATGDLELARNRRDAGAATDADVLQIDVHLAQAREQQIRSRAEVAVARARLNQVLGEPLDTVFALDDAPEPVAMDGTAVAALEAAAVAERPDLKLAGVQERLAAAGVAGARAAFLPRVSAQAGWEANGGTLGARSSSWMVGAVARVNLFRGFADQARLAEAREAQSLRTIERERAETAARLEVREGAARLEAARAAETVGRAAVAQAREGHRILRDRYEGGLADVTALLRAAEAVQQAEARHAAARVEVMVAAATLKRAAGTR
ncbi:MAG TPA: TolC family protein [Vicinamibacterales bacterium]|nr:TolC family protein [Vicinamibacterales bacterium]